MRSPRDIAADWHGGQWTPLYAFASSGHIGDREDLLAEIRACRRMAAGHSGFSQQDLNELDALRQFIEEEEVSD